MALQNATLTFTYLVNASLQVGDIVYYSTISSSGGFTTVLPSNTVEFGTVSAISTDGLSIDVIYETDSDGDGVDDVFPPGINDYISFAKDKQINSSSLVGYYAEAKFINNSKEKAELFSVGSEVSESSK
jgi:hypothetical protein